MSDVVDVTIFKALNDPTRIKIVNLILKKKMSVQEIAETLKIDQALVSYHLKHLRNYNLVDVERMRKSNQYSIRSEKREIIDLLLKIPTIKDRKELFKHLLPEFQKELSMYVGEEIAENYIDNLKKEISGKR